MWTRQELKFYGRQLYKKNYAESVGVVLVFVFLSGIFSTSGSAMFQWREEMNSKTGFHHETLPLWMIFLILAGALLAVLFGIFVVNILEVGKNYYFIRSHTQNGRMGDLLVGFRADRYGNLVKTMFRRDLYVLLWSLLFVIPGIIKSYEYMMVPYILAENPGMRGEEAFLISRQMMDGKKAKVFVLDLSFIGWQILSLVTCGILGTFMVNPYYYATQAEVYFANKAEAYQKGYIR